MTDYIDIDEDEAKQRLADLKWTGAGKKPLYSQIMVGYMLAKAIWFFMFFTKKALSCIDTGIADMNADNTPTDALEAAEPKALILELQALVLRHEAAIHVMLSEGVQAKGYGKFNSAISQMIGAGVIRK